MAKLRETMNTESTPPKTKRNRARIPVYLNDDGTPAYNELTDEQRATLGVAPGANRPTPPPPPPPPPEFNADAARSLLMVAVSIESMVLASKFSIDADAARNAVAPAPQIAAGLVSATQSVMNKYAGSLSEWTPELTLVAMIITWQSTAFANIRSIVANRPAPPAPPPPIDIRESTVTDAAPGTPQPREIPDPPVYEAELI